MSPFDLAALLLTLLAAAGWLNARTLRLPNGVAMLLVGLAGAAVLIGLRAAGSQAAADLLGALSRVNFARALLGYLLAFLLFAGAMQVDLAELRRRRLSVLTLATLGVVASTAIVGTGLWATASALGLALPLPWTLVFGALISPTDPIAVLAAVRQEGLSSGLRAILQGEALFNDGVGIVVFTALVAFAGGAAPGPLQALESVFIQALGGLAVGAAGGLIVLRAMRAIDDFVVEVSLSLALAAGAYALAQGLHLSGPIAVVGAGLLVGDAHAGATSATTQTYLRSFWRLVDEILNALLFFLLGLQLFVVRLQAGEAGLCAAAIALTLLARLAVIMPWGSYLHLRREERGASVILAWGGLHGALSLALALIIPAGPERPLILAITYLTVIFSIAVQGLTFGPLIRRLGRAGGAGPAARAQ